MQFMQCCLTLVVLTLWHVAKELSKARGVTGGSPVCICYDQGWTAEQCCKRCAVQMQLLSMIVVHSVYYLLIYSSGDAPDAAANHVASSKRGYGQPTAFPCSNQANVIQTGNDDASCKRWQHYADGLQSTLQLAALGMLEMVDSTWVKGCVHIIQIKQVKV